MIHALTLQSQFILANYIRVNRLLALSILREPLAKVGSELQWKADLIRERAKVIVRQSENVPIPEEEIATFLDYCQSTTAALADFMNPEDIAAGLSGILRNQQ